MGLKSACQKWNRTTAPMVCEVAGSCFGVVRSCQRGIQQLFESVDPGLSVLRVDELQQVVHLVQDEIAETGSHRAPAGERRPCPGLLSGTGFAYHIIHIFACQDGYMPDDSSIQWGPYLIVFALALIPTSAGNQPGEALWVEMFGCAHGSILIAKLVWGKTHYDRDMSVMDPKAILDGRTGRGVPAGAIIAIAASSVCLAGFLGIFLIVGGTSFIVAAILSLITLVPMMAGVLALDRLDPEPMFMLVMAFLWGAGTSTIISLILESLGFAALQPGLGDYSDAAGAVILAPVVEETMKGLILFGIFWFRRREIDGITDGIVYAATTALGFAAAENIVYYISSASDGAPALAAVFIVRGILSPFCHPVFTSMTGVALALAVRRKSVTARIFIPLGGLLLAMCLHAFWNGSALFGLAGLSLAFLVVVGVLIGLLAAIFSERKRTVAKIQACAAQYVPTGLVTYADLLMLSSLDSRKKARVWARATHGVSGFNAMRDYQMACTKLTSLHDRAANGTISRAYFDSQQANLLALMRVARQAFLGPRYMSVPMMTAPGPQYAPPMQPQYRPAPQQYQPLQPAYQPAQPAYQPAPTQYQPAPIPAQPAYQSAQSQPQSAPVSAQPAFQSAPAPAQSAFQSGQLAEQSSYPPVESDTFEYQSPSAPVRPITVPVYGPRPVGGHPTGAGAPSGDPSIGGVLGATHQQPLP